MTTKNHARDMRFQAINHLLETAHLMLNAEIVQNGDREPIRRTVKRKHPVKHRTPRVVAAARTEAAG